MAIIKPDFARLKNNLLSSGIQKSNNALYQIIDELIKVSEQQQTVTGESISEITNIISAGLSVSVSTTGALDGNGLVASPLSVRTDDLSVLKDANNNLSSRIYRTKTRLTDSQIKALNTTPVTLVAAPGANKAIAPVFIAIASHVTTGYNTGSSVKIRYNGIASDVMSLVDVSSIADDRLSITAQNSNFNTVLNDVWVNKSLEIGNRAVGLTGGTSTNFYDAYMFYVLLELDGAIT
jgi:hypothetical protein